MPTIHIIIKGKVQGVFYRVTAKKAADNLGINGWIKNTKSGNVELKASGEKEALDKLVEWCRMGPREAVVTKVEVTAVNEEAFDSFSILR